MAGWSRTAVSSPVSASVRRARISRGSPARRRFSAGRTWWKQSIGGHGLRRVRELDLDTHALALCAQQVLCVAPLVVAISALTQRLLHRNVSFYIVRFLGLRGSSANDVEQLFGRSAHSISTIDLLIGMVATIVFAASVATVQQRGYEMIWTLPRISGPRSYMRQLLWAPALSAYCVAMLIAGRAGQWINHHVVGLGTWAGMILQAIVTLGFYWWTQHWLLRGRVAWRSLFPGALAVSLLLIVIVQLSRLVLPSQISWQVHAYGEIGAVFMLSIWFVAASVIIFLGVLMGALLSERRNAPHRRRTGAPGVPPLTERGLASAAAAERAAADKSVPINQIAQQSSDKLPMVGG
jgi:membrane protein